MGMRILLASSGCLLSVLTAWTQTTPPPGTISRNPNQALSNSAPAKNFDGAGLTFTNLSGGTFTVDQLAGQMRRLRVAVDDVMPALVAFTESVSNSVTAGGQQTIGGAIAGILAGILNRNHTNDNPSSTRVNSSALQATNLLSALQRALVTNAPASSPPANDTATYAQLVELQNHLQPIPSLLQSLNVASGLTNQVPPYDNSRSGRLTPTGR